MRKTFVIITAQYDRESFLQSECRFYKTDDRVLIFNIGNYADEGQQLKCKKQNNISIYSGCFHKISKIKMFYMSLINRHYWVEIFNLAFREKKFSVARACEAASIMAHAKKFAKEIKRLLSNEKICDDSTVFYSYWLSIQTAIILELKKWYPKGVYISRCHGMDVYEIQTKNNYEPFCRYFIKKIDYLYAISEDGKKYIEKKMGKENPKIQVEHLGSSNYLPFNETYLKKRNKLSIVTCSRIDRNKRLDRVVKILSSIHDIEIQWVHYGDGDDEIKDQLKHMCSEMLGPNISVSFMGLVDNNDIVVQYHHMDYELFMNMSESEGIPVSIMEALSEGIPVVALDVGGMREIVKSGINGFLLKNEFILDEAIETLRLIADMEQEEYNALRLRARNFWNTYYNAEINYDNFIKKIRSV